MEPNGSPLFSHSSPLDGKEEDNFKYFIHSAYKQATSAAEVSVGPYSKINPEADWK
jgi:hypothetical protein